MNAAQLAELELVFRFALRLPVGVDLSDIHRAVWSEWDSMAQVSLTAAIESQFDLALSAAEAMRIDSWESCLSIIAMKVQN